MIIKNNKKSDHGTMYYEDYRPLQNCTTNCAYVFNSTPANREINTFVRGISMQSDAAPPVCVYGTAKNDFA